jgi:hypothetical protein
MARLPLDLNAVPMPGFEYLATPQRQTLTAGAATSNATIPTGSAGRFVVVRVSAPVFINFGAGGVTAAQDNSSMLWAGSELCIRVPSTATHVAVIRVGATDAKVQLELFSDSAV